MERYYGESNLTFKIFVSIVWLLAMLTGFFASVDFNSKKNQEIL